MADSARAMPKPAWVEHSEINFMPSLFEGLDTPRWIGPDEESATNQQAAQQQVQGWLQQRVQKLNEDSQKLKTAEVMQNLQMNQSEIDARLQDQQTIPQWLQKNNTWDKRNAADDMPVPQSKWGMETMQQVRLNDAQNIGKETLIRSTEDFTKRFHQLTPEFSSKVIQLPSGPNGQPSPAQWDALNAAEQLMADRDRKQKVDDQLRVKTEQEKLAETLATKKAADAAVMEDKKNSERTAMEDKKNSERATSQSQKHQWVVENIDHRHELSAQAAQAQIKSKEALARFNQQAQLIRNPNFSPEQQAQKMKDLETAFKVVNGGFHDFTDEGTLAQPDTTAAKAGFKSADEVRAAYSGGKLSKAEATKILQDNFGFK